MSLDVAKRDSCLFYHPEQHALETFMFIENK